VAYISYFLKLSLYTEMFLPFYKNLPLDSLPMQVTSMHTTLPYVFELHLGIILPFTPRIFQDWKPESKIHSR